MKHIKTLLLVILSLSSSIVYAVAPLTSTPEIDTGSAAIGLGLVVGVTALIVERRRKK